MRPAHTLTAAKALLFAAAVVVLFLLPRWVGDYEAYRLALVAIYAIAIMGLNILTGYSGQISLGHGAFMAIGGYTTAILVSGETVPGWFPGFLEGGVKDAWTIPIAGLVTGVIGFLFGIPALRLTGIYLSLATFAVAVSLPSLIKRFSDFTGGGTGIQLFGSDDLTGAISGVNVHGHHLTPNDWWYYETTTIALVLFIVAWFLLRGQLGLTLRAVRDNEGAASSFGVNLAAAKTVAFGISAFYAGVAGSLYAIVNTFVNPQAYPVTLSLTLVIGLVIGGLGSLPFVVLGALFVEYMPIVAGHYSSSAGFPDVIYGAAVIVLMLLLPGGAGRLVGRAFAPLTTRAAARSYSKPGRPASFAKES